MGSVFLLAAVHTRSLLWPMLGHATYDWAVLDTQRYISAGASNLPSLLMGLFALVLGCYCLCTLWHVADRVPYVD